MSKVVKFVGVSVSNDEVYKISNNTYGKDTESISMIRGNTYEISNDLYKQIPKSLFDNGYMNLVEDKDLTSNADHNQLTNLQATVNSQEVNVRSYGAKGDGIADDTSAIQSAINYANSIGGGNIYIPAGTYMINAIVSINLYSNIRLTLAKNAILKAKTNSVDNYAIIKILEKDNVTITGGTLVGDRTTHTGTTGQWGMGISILGSTNVIISEVTTKDCWGDGFYIAESTTPNVCKNITIKNCIADNNRRQGMSITSGQNILVEGSTFKNTNGSPNGPVAGIDLEANSPYNLLFEDIRLVSNWFYNNDGWGIQISHGQKIIITGGNEISWNKLGGIIIANSNNCTVSSNMIHDNSKSTTTNSAVYTGSWAIGNSNAGCGIFVNISTDSTIQGNRIYNNANNGIYALNGIDRTIVNGNNVYNNIQDGINIYGSPSNSFTAQGNICDLNGHHGMSLSQLNYSSVTGNTLTNNTNDGMLIYSCTYSSVVSNTIYNNGSNGIELGSANYNQILSNICTGNSQTTNITYSNIGVYFGSSYNNIKNNMCRAGSNTNKAQYGLYIKNAANSNIVDGNDLAGGGITADYLDVTTGTATQGYAINQTTNAIVLSNGSTISTNSIRLYRANPSAAVTGVIMQAGSFGGQEIIVVNESTSANSITFAAASSNVADGSSDVISGGTARKFVWDSSTSLWYRLQ